MRRLVPALLLVACGVPVVQPLDEAKRLEPDKAVPKDSKDAKAGKPPAPAPAPTPPPPAPYVRPGDARTQTDDLTFWGWSADGARYAFELHDHGPGARGCEGSYTLYVVDVPADKFVDGTPLVVEHRTGADEACDPPDLAAEMERQRPAVLQQHGIVVGNQRAPLFPTPITTSTGREKFPSWQILLGPGLHIQAELEVRHGGREKAGEPGAAYRLDLTRGAEHTLVEPGTRRRPFIWHYSLDGGLVFVSPDERRLAILVATKRLSFEGDRHSWTSNALVLPQGWHVEVPG